MNNARSQEERCAVCGKSLAKGWFARFRDGEGLAEVCSPACSIHYSALLRPTDGSDKQEDAGYEHRLRFFFNGEVWS